jgi:hypothetical protein
MQKLLSADGRALVGTHPSETSGAPAPRGPLFYHVCQEIPLLMPLATAAFKRRGWNVFHEP